jgi:fucokinase
MTSYKKMKNLFLRQSCLDSWEDYERSLRKSSFIKWDYIILTASNETQARAFRLQIKRRLDRQQLPDATKYVVLPDPGGKRVGSGGATFHVIRYLAEQAPDAENPFSGKRILVIHSGGDSKRVPQYSALGKLFSPVPRELPDGRGSTLFDEFIIGMSGVPSRIREGMLVLSGDVLLLFNPLQIDFQFQGAAAISIKEPVETGKDHGVFLNDGNGYVKSFLHKQTEETLRQTGAVNERGAVDLDTGAIILDADLLHSLYGLISTDGKPDEKKYDRFVNERSRVSFYGDFLYPLASSSTLEQYYREKPEGEFTEELKSCRREIWEALKPFSLKLLCLSPAQFIHFGTTHELRQLVAEEIGDFEFLDWQRQVNSTRTGDTPYSAYGSYVGRRVTAKDAVYLENSYILDESRIGQGSIVSHLKLRNVRVPDQVVLHGLPLKGNTFTVRIYGVSDNPKGSYASDTAYMHTTIKRFLQDNRLSAGDLWEETDTRDLWNARLFPVCATLEEAVSWALTLYRMASGTADKDTPASWRKKERVSLCQSFHLADLEKVLDWQTELETRIFCRKFIDLLADGVYYKEALRVFGQNGITDAMYKTLMEDASQAEFSVKIRIFYAVSQYMKEQKRSFAGRNYDYTEGLCFQTIQQAVYEEAIKKLPDASCYRIARDQVEIQLPVRVNWGGGWTDTPPYCNENGGVVLNAAISLNGILPVQITVKRLPDYHIEFESQDIGVFGQVDTVKEIQDCHNPYDSFALHKAALIACGIVPLQGGKPLAEILQGLGGGLYLSTQVIGIPKGSGLGTSSILAGACVKGLFEFLGQEKSNEEIYEIVLSMEQIMSTGGGWQDQVGGLTGGIKFISTRPGIAQNIEVTPVQIPEEAMEELQERFALVYTGQRRLARNLLRDVVGNYIGARPASVEALKNMQPVAALMKHYLERGDIDAFAGLMNEHWELSKQLDRGSTNTCIDQIFVSCEDLIDARFIAGAGGGGFIMVLLKKGISREMLRERLAEIFQDSGVDVWESAFV